MSDEDVFKTRPFRHQLEVFHRAKDLRSFALFWEQGLGKTKTILDVISHHWAKKRIDAVLIVAPNSVYTNWAAIEAPLHLSAPALLGRYRTRGDKRRRLREQLFLDPSWDNTRLRLLTMSYDSAKTTRGFEYARSFCTIYRTMIVADESTAMKNAKTDVAKAMKKLRDICQIAWIATGTPVAQSPFDAHSQIEFLDEDFWREHGLKRFSAFKAQFGVYERMRVRGGRQFDALKDYKNLDRLNSMIAPISSRLLKEDSEVELPPKRYSYESFEMTTDQQDLYDQVREEFTAELSSVDRVDATLAITRLTRLQQIACGHVTVEERLSPEDPAREAEAGLSVQMSADYGNKIADSRQLVLDDYSEAFGAASPDSTEDLTVADQIAELGEEIAQIPTIRKTVDLMPPEENPRLIKLRQILERREVKTIIFCRFRRDVDLICDMLGDQCVRYDGAVRARQREENIARFRGEVRYLVANVHALSMGLTLTEAKRTVYYSNSFSLEKRLQSEDRTHRIGQEDEVEIVDMAAEETVDEHTIEALRKKYEIAALVTGDRLREWLS